MSAVLTQVEDPFSAGLLLVGGLALFLYGMERMTAGLRASTGEAIRQVLARFTDRPLAGMVTGATLTAVVNSSTVTTVVLVGFLSAGLMTLPQSIGVIIGANIGSTFTAQIIAFNVTRYSLILVSAGVAGHFLARKELQKRLAEVTLGIGLIFFGMGMMSDATYPFRDYPPFMEWMQQLDHAGLAILTGAVFTVIIQSSAATAGLVIVMAAQGSITLEAGIGLVLGANIGTCVKALVVAIGKPRPAVQAVLVHLIFNIVGAAIWFGFIPWLADVARWLSPSYPDLSGIDRLAAEAPRQIANAHTVFNVANALLFIGFTKPLAALVRFLAPDRAAPGPLEPPRLLDTNLLNTPALAIDRLRLECAWMASEMARMLELVKKELQSGETTTESLSQDYRILDTVYEATVVYIRELLRRSLSASESRKTSAYLEIAGHLHAAGRIIGEELSERLAQGRKLRLSAVTRDRLAELASVIRDALKSLHITFENEDGEAAWNTLEFKSPVDRIGIDLTDHLGKRLTADEPDRLATYRLEAELASGLRKVFVQVSDAAKVFIALDRPPR